MGTASASPMMMAPRRVSGRQATVKSDLASQGQTLRAQQTQKADSSGPSSEPQCAAGQREQDGFDHRLADHVPPARAQRLTDGKFLHAAAGADEKKVGKVDAADQ